MAAKAKSRKAGKAKRAPAKSGKARTIRVRGKATRAPSRVERGKLWAPWRLAYIKTSDWNKPAGCVLCNLLKEKDGPGNLILKRNKSAYLVMNRFPYTNGHLMVVPQRHTADFTSVTEAEGKDIHALLQEGVSALQRAFRTHGFNIGMNLGKVAGAGIAEHLHFHIVPRWNGDTNFMPVLADVNVINDHMESSYHAIREELEKR